MLGEARQNTYAGRGASIRVPREAIASGGTDSGGVDGGREAVSQATNDTFRHSNKHSATHIVVDVAHDRQRRVEKSAKANLTWTL